MDPSRRAFLEKSALGALALAALPACLEGDGTVQEDGAGRVAIIGAGMAGLMCARVLEEGGATATLFEASKRVGGRMFTARGMFPDGQVAELGGELIDTDHVLLTMLAEELDITLDDRLAAVGEETRADVWWVNGAAVPEATIVAQFSKVAVRWARFMEQADQDESVFVTLDGTTLADFFDAELADAPELKSVLTSAYRGEYGRELGEQSALNLIYLIGSDTPSEFRIFGDSDERYHAHAGSETFPEKVAEALASEVRLEHRLVKAETKGGSYLLTFETPGGRVEDTVEQIVFALPFTLLRKVDLDGLGLSSDKRTIIRELGYGTNAKVMGAFTARVWRTQYDALGSVTSDEPFQQCWDTSIGQPGESGLITNFLGGEQGVASGQKDDEAWYTEVLVPGLDKVFPGAKDAYVAGSAVGMHWPTAPYQLGSYACYAPGQWVFWGTEGASERDGTVHFCGEHTSLDFQGYMEGAAETGALVASAVLKRLGKTPSNKHAALLALKRVVPQPALGDDVRAMTRAERLLVRRLALRSWAKRS